MTLNEELIKEKDQKIKYLEEQTKRLRDLNAHARSIIEKQDNHIENLSNEKSYYIRLSIDRFENLTEEQLHHVSKYLKLNPKLKTNK